MPKMIKCKTCGNDIASSAKNCPSCGAKNKKPIYKKVWFWIIVLIVVAGAIGGGNSTSNTKTNQSTQVNDTSSIEDTKNEVENKEEKKEDLEIVGDITDESDQFATYISGVIKNNTDKKYSYVQVTFNLYDADGNLIGTALDNVNNLEANGTWKFKAMGISENGTVASYKISEITGF